MVEDADATRPRSPSSGTSRLGIYGAHDFPLSLEIADPDNWKWSDAAKSLYTPASDEWISLREKWYGNIGDSLVDADSGGLLLGPLTNQVAPRLSSSIFIRECYEDLFNTIWAQAMAKHGRGGVIITGQPGVGKTMFNFYVLVRLLQRKQVVLYSTGSREMLLFFHNGVYTVPSSIGTSLPKAKSNESSAIFIWCLFDVAVEKRSEEFLLNFPLFPVQNLSPGSCQSQLGVSNLQIPLVTGMPLWSRSDIDKALRFQCQYSDMMQALRAVYGPQPAPAWDPLGLFPGARAVLNAWNQDNLESGPSPDDALQHLLDTAIYRFGRSAGDVFKGIFSFKAMTQMHQHACRLTHAELRSVVTDLTTDRYPAYPVSSFIFVLEPVYDVNESLAWVDWHVNFKSPWVANNVLHELAKADANAAVEQIRYLKGIPEAHGILGRLLEPWAHRHIATGAHNHEGASRFWPLRSMFAGPSHPPCFSLNKR